MPEAKSKLQEIMSYVAELETCANEAREELVKLKENHDALLTAHENTMAKNKVLQEGLVKVQTLVSKILEATQA